MLRTLFYIPHEFAGVPLFGFGWVLLLLCIGLGGHLSLAYRRGGSVSAELKQSGPFWLLLGFVVVVVLPQVELRGVQTQPDQPGQPIGIAIRGYGVMVLLGVVSAIGLAVYRAPRRGLSSDIIFGLAPWLLICGVLGARLFYVIEYRDQFFVGDLRATLGNVLDFTRGGLVVYGSIIGGALGAFLFCRRHNVPALRLGDVIIPCLFLGIFFGRIGCLLNGCCYGGVCQPDWYALHFPAGSPLYAQQLNNGMLVGIEFAVSKSEQLSLPARIQRVASGSLAEEAGVKPDEFVSRIAPIYPSVLEIGQTVAEEDVRPVGLRVDVGDRTLTWTADQLPAVSLPAWPSQLIASGAGLLLCCLLLGLSRWSMRYEGMLVAIGFMSYAVIRFGLEMLRSDEPGQFGTGLTISQWVSLVVFVAAGSLARRIASRKQTDVS